METECEFKLEDWDDLSDTSTMHLSYIIQNLLPIRLVGWKAVRRHYDGVISGIKQSLDATETYDDSEYIVTGSTAEGFGMPLCMKKTTPPIMERFSDIDMLYVPPDMLVSTVELPTLDDTEYKAYFDSKGLHPGYTRICLPSFKKMDDTFVYDDESGKYYFSGIRYMQKLSSQKFDLEGSETVWVQGPALTIEDDRVMTLENLKKSNAGSSRDIVTALKCTPWPREASAWKERALKSKWLTEDIVQSILDDGCHVVAVPSKNSLKPELEWRISFSASEGKLAREAVTDYQRQCYIYLKILRYQIMKPVSVLSSYVFKSVFLHCCEKLPAHHWEKAPGNCVLFILDVILECLRKKFVPTYFLPENNLVDHLTDDELKTAIDAVKKLREDPISPVLEFTDERVIGYHSIFASFRELTKPLLEDMKLFKVHRNKEMSVMCGIMQTGVFMCQFLLNELTEDKEIELTKHQEAVRIIIDIYQLWLRPLGLNASLAEYTNSAGLSQKDLKLAVRFFQAMVSLSTEYPEFLAVRGNLACMYHACAYLDDEANPNPEYMKRAGELFEQVHSECNRSVIDYVTYLVKLKKFSDAEIILDKFLQESNGEFAGNTSFSYTQKEMNTLQGPLRQRVADHGSLDGDGASFAYYYLVKCAIEIGTETAIRKIDDILKRFEAHCEQKNNDNAQRLLEYARDISKSKMDNMCTPDLD